MNAKQITAVLAVVAILAAGVVGLGYAYTATTENASNTSEAAYLTLASANESATGTLFADGFEDYEVTFNTINRGAGTGETTYAFAGTALKTDGSEGKKITVGTGTDAKDYYILGYNTLNIKSQNITSVANLDFTMNAVAKAGDTVVTGIDGTHYVYNVALVKQDSQKAIDVQLLDITADDLVNYDPTLAAQAQAGALDVGASFADLVCGNIGNDGVNYYVYLFVAASNEAATSAQDLPLTDVTFQFTATPDTNVTP